MRHSKTKTQSDRLLRGLLNPLRGISRILPGADHRDSGCSRAAPPRSPASTYVEQPTPDHTANGYLPAVFRGGSGGASSYRNHLRSVPISLEGRGPVCSTEVRHAATDLFRRSGRSGPSSQANPPAGSALQLIRPVQPASRFGRFSRPAGSAGAPVRTSPAKSAGPADRHPTQWSKDQPPLTPGGAPGRVLYGAVRWIHGCRAGW